MKKILYFVAGIVLVNTISCSKGEQQRQTFTDTIAQEIQDTSEIFGKWGHEVKIEGDTVTQGFELFKNHTAATINNSKVTYTAWLADNDLTTLTLVFEKEKRKKQDEDEDKTKNDSIAQPKIEYDSTTYSIFFKHDTLDLKNSDGRITRYIRIR